MLYFVNLVKYNYENISAHLYTYCTSIVLVACTGGCHCSRNFHFQYDPAASDGKILIFA